MWTEPEFLEKPFETCSLLMVKLRLSSECVLKMYSIVLMDITLSTCLISLGLLLLFSHCALRMEF